MIEEDCMDPEEVCSHHPRVDGKKRGWSNERVGKIDGGVCAVWFCNRADASFIAIHDPCTENLSFEQR